MKKVKFLMLLVFVVLLTACGTKKEAIDDEEFNRIMTDEGFSIVNVEQQFAENGYFEETYQAIDPNNNYEIGFYELESDSYAKKAYETSKIFFEKFRTSATAYTEVNLTNNSKYTLTTEDKYYVISRIEDTIIFLIVDKEYKDEATDILKKLGY